MVGVVQSTGRMNKTGKIPIMLFGLNIINLQQIAPRTASETNNTSKAGNVESEKKLVAKPPVPTTLLGWYEQIEFGLERDFRIVQKFIPRFIASAQHQLTKMSKTADAITDKLPEKMARYSLL